MARELTRRRAIAGLGSALAVGGSAGAAGASEQPEDAVVDIDRNGDAGYPRCLYKPDADGGWNPVMPINVHARSTGDASAVNAIEDGFSGLSNLEWTRVFPDATAKAWDADEEALVPPDHSFRRPRLGDEWNHVHVWAVDEDRAAIHAHLDVVDLTSAHFHRGDHYDDAAEEVANHLSGDGWSQRTPYSIDYGVSDGRREAWGETGDVKLEH